MGYEIIQEDSSKLLERKVKIFMNTGYIPVGAPFIRDVFGKWVWVQAVYKVSI